MRAVLRARAFCRASTAIVLGAQCPEELYRCQQPGLQAQASQIGRAPWRRQQSSRGSGRNCDLERVGDGDPPRADENERTNPIWPDICQLQNMLSSMDLSQFGRVFGDLTTWQGTRKEATWKRPNVGGDLRSRGRRGQRPASNTGHNGRRGRLPWDEIAGRSRLLFEGGLAARLGRARTEEDLRCACGFLRGTDRTLCWRAKSSGQRLRSRKMADYSLTSREPSENA